MRPGCLTPCIRVGTVIGDGCTALWIKLPECPRRSRPSLGRWVQSAATEFGGGQWRPSNARPRGDQCQCPLLVQCRVASRDQLARQMALCRSCGHQHFDSSRQLPDPPQLGNYAVVGVTSQLHQLRLGPRHPGRGSECNRLIHQLPGLIRRLRNPTAQVGNPRFAQLSFAYSVLASLRMGMSVSASFHRAKNF